MTVDDGRISAVLEEEPPEPPTEIDADGLMVTPGFVDIHTHLDAQVAWDPLGTSSSWHGVTSVVMGNCGVTFAPRKPEDRTYLADMMESVEDIPCRVDHGGAPWDWETYGDYLDSLERIDSVMNVGGMVGHCALRYWAMGDRSMDPDARRAPPSSTRWSVFSTRPWPPAPSGSRPRAPCAQGPRRTSGPRHVRGARRADRPRRGPGPRGRHLRERPRFDGDGPSEPRCRSELDWMREVALRSGRPVTFNLTHTFDNPDHHRLAIELAEAANAEGGPDPPPDHGAESACCSRCRPPPRSDGTVVGCTP